MNNKIKKLKGKKSTIVIEKIRFVLRFFNLLYKDHLLKNMHKYHKSCLKQEIKISQVNRSNVWKDISNNI